MQNMIKKTLGDLVLGDIVAYFCGYGRNVPPQEKKIARITQRYIILEGQSYDKFRKEDGCVVNFTPGKIERIAIPTPENLAQWAKRKLIEEFTELMNRRKYFEVTALRKALQRLLCEELTQDELIEIASVAIESKSLSTQTLKEAVDELWGGIS